MKKPKINNMLIAFVAIIVFIFVLIYYVSSRPNVPTISEPLPVGITMIKSPLSISTNTPTKEWKNININYPINSISAESQLEQEVDSLVERKASLEENIDKLKKENKALSDINYTSKMELIRFFERNRIKDIILSASIGATISFFLTLMFSIPVVRKKITQLFRDDN